MAQTHFYTDSYIKGSSTKELERISKDKYTDQATRDKASSILQSKSGGSTGSSGTSSGSGSKVSSTTNKYYDDPRSGSSSGSSSKKSSSGSSGTPNYLKDLTTVGTALGGPMGGLFGALAGGLASIGSSIAGNYGSSAGGGSSSGGFNPSQSLGGSSKPYATDDYGRTDYSVLIRDGIAEGDYDKVYQNYWARQGKIASDPSLGIYADDEINRLAEEFLKENAPPQQSWGITKEDIDKMMSDYLPSRPEYQSDEWEETANALAKAAMDMTYEQWLKSDQYTALAERFGLQGEMGMQDVLGQINSRTGGLASSYAATAAQQQYNQYMSQLEEVARQMYGAERSDALQKAQLAYQFSQANYQKYLDQLAQYNADRSFGFDVFDKILQDSHYNQQWQNTLKQQAYQQKRDEVNDQHYADEMAYNKGVVTQKDAQDRILQFIDAGGRVEDLAPGLIEASGYTPAELEAFQKGYGPQRQSQYTQQNWQTSDGPGSSYDNGKLTTENVKELQTYLRNNGVDIAVDGFWGPASQAAAGGMTADEMWAKYQTQNGNMGKTDTYDSLMDAISHINPGTGVNIAESFSKRIQAALDAGTLTQSEADRVLSRLGF